MTSLRNPLRNPPVPTAYRRSPGPLLGLAACVAVVLLAVACAGGPAGEANGEPGSDTAAHYEVRGQVTAVPTAGDPLSNLVIRHEAIDDFATRDGEVVGMSSMSMPFPLADGVSLDGIAPGDKVRFTLEVDWDGDPAYQITRIEPLPADTEIEYGKAHPPAAATDDDDESQQH